MMARDMRVRGFEQDPVSEDITLYQLDYELEDRMIVRDPRLLNTFESMRLTKIALLEGVFISNNSGFTAGHVIRVIATKLSASQRAFMLTGRKMSNGVVITDDSDFKVVSLKELPQ